MAGQWVRIAPLRPFAQICAEARELAAPAEFGGRDVVALEDWMNERNVHALTLQVEDGRALVTLTRRSGQRFAFPLGGDSAPGAMESPLVAALVQVIDQVEQADAQH
jgi:hypothetical protein